MIDTMANDRTEYLWDETRNAVMESTANDCYYSLLAKVESGVLSVFIGLAFELDGLVVSTINND